MDPYLGPVAGALLAALGAGVALGVVRLHRVSLAWWRRRAAASSPAPAAAPVAPDVSAASADASAIDPAVAPPVFAPLGAIAAVALVVAGLAIVAGAAAPGTTWRPLVLRPIAPAPLSELAARVSSVVGFAVLAVVVTAGVALLAAELDRAIGRLRARLARRGAAGDADAAALSVPDIVATARSLLPGAPAPARGEPFGVGLAYVALFGAATLGVGALIAAFLASAESGLHGRITILMSGVRDPGPLPPDFPAMAALAALAFLATPVLYAAAAERSRDPLRARLRRDAAVRQLVAAPVWLIAGAVLVGGRVAPLPIAATIVAVLLFVAAAAVALPGAGADPDAWIAPPRGGDRAEPATAVRALTGVAHFAWIVVLAVLPFVARPAWPPGQGVPWGALGLGGLALVLFLVVRAALPRIPAFRRTAAPAAPVAAGDVS